MGQKILLINPQLPPSKRRKLKSGEKKMSAARKRAGARRRRTPAQIAATRRLVAANRRRARKPARRRNPISPARAAAYNAVPMANPIRRRRRPVRRRNPISKVAPFITDSFIGSAWGAAGAVAVDAFVGMVPLPVQLKTGYAKYALKGLLSGAAGVVAQNLVNRRAAKSIAAGGLTVALYQCASKFVTENVPGVTLGYYNASLPAGGRLNAYTPAAQPVNVMNDLAPGSATQLQSYSRVGRSEQGWRQGRGHR